jgi:ATP-dependent DNA helicase 2 subunit 1
VRGSACVCVALLERLAAQDKVAIARLIMRDEAAPRLVALLPQRERVDGKGVQIAAPGFHMLFLPFNDDLRKLPHAQGVPGTHRPSPAP